MIVLKHLAKEYNIEPLRLRQLLRSAKFKPQNGRWRWNEDIKADMKKLDRIRVYLDQLPNVTRR